jgi:hypothetical protein
LSSSPAVPLAVGAPSSPWEVPAFRHYLAGVASVTLANQLQGTVVAYRVYELTRSPLSLGIIGLAEALPFISLALLTLVVAATAAFRAPALRDLGALDQFTSKNSRPC